MTDTDGTPADPAVELEHESDDDALPTDLGTITEGELLDDDEDEVDS